jgi:hypothetical protein
MDQSQVAQLLEEMGATHEEVAQCLRASGVQGVRNTARFLNPIVRYVQALVRVDARSLDLMQPGMLRLVLGNGRKIETSLPEAVRQFLDAFNRGAYSELELPGND